MFAIFAAVASTFFAFTAKSEDITLPTIVKEGSVSDVLMEDPILPSQTGKSKAHSTTGGLEHGLAQDLPVAIVDTGQPGNLAQIRGLGQSAEETNVQTLGIPLNGPQGGRGFDFSTFPAFFWDDYQYRLGPSLGVFDPAGISGSLTLHPWTESVLNRAQEDFSGRVTAFGSDANLKQISAGAIVKDTAAILAGYSLGRTQGPSGSISAQRRFGNHRARFHFLGTDADSLSRQYKGAPFDQKHTIRWIPVAQTDFDLGGDMLLKNTLFHDSTTLRSIPGNPSPRERSSVVRTTNTGTQNALLVGDWKFGLSAEHVRYFSSSIGIYRQNAFNLQGARSFDLDESGATVLEPTLRGTLVSGYSVLPEGSLGMSHSLSPMASVFARATYSRKFPTLADRFYSFPGRFEGNPDLKPERDWTGVLGVKIKPTDRQWTLTAQVYSQFRFEGQVLTGLPSGSTTYTNADRATIHALLVSGDIRVMPWLDLKNGLTYSRSHISSTDDSFPNIPTWLNIFTTEFHESAEDPAWSASIVTRASTSSSTGTPHESTAGYAFFDLQSSIRLWRGQASRLSLGASVANVLSREIEMVKNSPIEGRTISGSLVGEF